MCLYHFKGFSRDNYDNLIYPFYLAISSRQASHNGLMCNLLFGTVICKFIRCKCCASVSSDLNRASKNCFLNVQLCNDFCWSHRFCGIDPYEFYKDINYYQNVFVIFVGTFEGTKVVCVTCMEWYIFNNGCKDPSCFPHLRITKIQWTQFAIILSILLWSCGIK